MLFFLHWGEIDLRRSLFVFFSFFNVLYYEKHTKEKLKFLKAPFSRVVIVIARPNY